MLDFFIIKYYLVSYIIIIPIIYTNKIKDIINLTIQQRTLTGSDMLNFVAAKFNYFWRSQFDFLFLFKTSNFVTNEK